MKGSSGSTAASVPPPGGAYGVPGRGESERDTAEFAEFAAFHREHTGRLLGFLEILGAERDTARRIAHDTMAAALRSLDSAPRDGRVLDARWRTWTCRVAAGALERLSPAEGPGARGAATGPRGPLPGAASRQRVLAWSTVCAAPGEIAYEVCLPVEEVTRILRAAADAPHGLGAGAADSDHPADADAALASATGPQGTIGLARVLPRPFGWHGLLPVRPYALPAVPVPGTPPPAPGAEPAPSAIGAHVRAVSAAVAGAHVRDAFHLPLRELAAVRLAAELAFHADRFRTTFGWTRSETVEAQAHAFASAFARDIAMVPEGFADAEYAADTLVLRLTEREDWIAVESAALELSEILSACRAEALDALLTAVRPGRAFHPALKDAVTRDLLRAHTMTRELDFLGEDLAYDLLQPEFPGSDPFRDLGRHQAFTRHLMHGLDALEEALTDLRGADVGRAELKGVPLDGVRWSDGTRWPDDWADRIRGHSVTTASGEYAILPGLPRWPGPGE